MPPLSDEAFLSVNCLLVRLYIFFTLMLLYFRYGQLERAILTNEISGVDLRGAVTRGVGAQGVNSARQLRGMRNPFPKLL